MIADLEGGLKPANQIGFENDSAWTIIAAYFRVKDVLAGGFE